MFCAVLAVSECFLLLCDNGRNSTRHSGVNIHTERAFHMNDNEKLIFIAVECHVRMACDEERNTKKRFCVTQYFCVCQKVQAIKKRRNCVSVCI